MDNKNQVTCPKCKGSMSYQNQLMVDSMEYMTGYWFCLCGARIYDTLYTSTMAPDRAREASKKGRLGTRDCSI
mgnify:CR=1 FL=1